MGLQQSFLFVLEPVAVGGEEGEFVGLGGHQLVELVVQHPGNDFAVGGADLDALVVVLDQLLHVGDQDRPAGAVGAFGVPAGADEVAVDVACRLDAINRDPHSPQWTVPLR